MDQYRVHDVKIRKGDQVKADAILVRHYNNGNIDDYTVSCITRKSCDGNHLITYQIRPYIYEDLETIINEFKQAGITVL